MPSIKVVGGEMNYVERGRGTPVVLVHGFPLDATIWTAQLEALSDEYRVITPDLPGFGKSPAGSGPFTIESLADSVDDFMCKVNARGGVLGGLSMGGYVAFAHLVKYPTHLKAVMLIDTKCEADTAEGKAGRGKMIEAVRQNGSKAAADAMEPKMFAPDAGKGRPELVKRLRGIMEACPAETIVHALAAMRDREDYRDKLASIAVPTLVIAGDQDVIMPLKGAEAMQREIPNSRLAVIKGAGHLAPMEQPEQVNRAIREFLQTL
jgi:3-oxoadipate enol-lactonase